MHCILEQRYTPDSVDPSFVWVHSKLFTDRRQARLQIDWLLDKDRHNDNPLDRGDIVRYSIVDMAIDVTYTTTVGISA